MHFDYNLTTIFFVHNKKYRFKVHIAYNVEIKRDLDLPVYDALNAVNKLKQPRKHLTTEKVEAIKIDKIL